MFINYIFVRLDTFIYIIFFNIILYCWLLICMYYIILSSMLNVELDIFIRNIYKVQVKVLAIRHQYWTS